MVEEVCGQINERNGQSLEEKLKLKEVFLNTEANRHFYFDQKDPKEEHYSVFGGGGRGNCCNHDLGWWEGGVAGGEA